MTPDPWSFIRVHPLNVREYLGRSMVGEALSHDELLPSETTVLETLASANTSWTQRSLAHRTGYSIGLINTILKKLSKTGYIKITSIDKRRLQYLLTPMGVTQTSKTACTYVLKTFRDYQSLYLQVSAFFNNLYEQGHRDLHVCCDNAELCQLIQVVLKDSGLHSIINFHEAGAQGVTVVHLNGAAVSATGPLLNLAVQPCESRAS